MKEKIIPIINVLFGFAAWAAIGIFVVGVFRSIRHLSNKNYRSGAKLMVISLIILFVIFIAFAIANFQPACC